MISLRVPSTLEASGCIFRRLIERETEPRGQERNGESLYRLLLVRPDDDAVHLFFLPPQVQDLHVEWGSSVRQVVTRGQRLELVPADAKLKLTALASFFLLVIGEDQATTRAVCISRVRHLRGTFPKICAQVLPTIPGNSNENGHGTSGLA